MIFTDKAAKEKIQDLESRVSELEADISAKDAAIETLQADITAKDQTIAENVHLIAARDEQINTLNGELTEANTKLESVTAELAEAKESAGKQATEILASIGQEKPLDQMESSPFDPVSAYIAAIESGNKELRAEIFKKHKEAILAHRAKLNQ